MLAFTVCSVRLYSCPLRNVNVPWPSVRKFPMLADWLLEELAPNELELPLEMLCELLEEPAALEEFALLEVWFQTVRAVVSIVTPEVPERFR